MKTQNKSINQENSLLPRLLHLFVHWAFIPLLAIGMTLWPTLSSGMSQLQTDPGDTLLNLYFLEHAYNHFKEGGILHPSDYWSPDFFWPIQDTLAWSDHLLGPSVLYAFFRSFLDQYQSYLAWLSTTLWLNFVSIRIATKRISPETLPIWLSIAALVTTFSPTITQQLNHPQLLSLFLIGPILWLCHRLLYHSPRSFNLSDWIALGTWLLTNGFFNIYIFVYTCYGTLICISIHLIRRTISKQWDLVAGKKLLPKFTLFAACLTLNLTIYIPYLQTLRTFGKRPIGEILSNLPKPESWLYSSNQWLFPGPLNPNTIHPGSITGLEQELFPGWGLCLLLTAAVLTAWTCREKSDQSSLTLWILAVAAMVIGCLSIHNLSLWPLISKFLLGASSLRASSRVGMIIVLFSAPVICIAARNWRLSHPRNWEFIASASALMGAFAGLWAIGQPAFSLKTWKLELRSISEKLNKSNCEVFWYEWSDQEPWRANIIAMFAQQTTRIPTVNGYSGHFPRENWPFSNPLGESAFNWIIKSNPGQYHRLKPSSSRQRLCITTYSAGAGSRIRPFDPSGKTNFKAPVIRKPDEIIFSDNNVVIAQKSGFLYFKKSGHSTDGEWIMLTRDGNPIPADRGDYGIQKAQEANADDGRVILITDKNNKLGIEYEWTIDYESGRFMGQKMRAFKRH